MKKLVLAASLAALATIGFAATEASAKGGFGGGHGPFGHGPFGPGGWGHHNHFNGGWGFGGYRPVVYIPRCRMVPGVIGWVRLCR